MDIGVDEIRKWHTDKGWADVGYHYVVRRGGKVEKGRQDEQVGAHVEGHNATSIGICCVGGVNASNAPDSNFTRQQWAALEILVKRLTTDYPDAQVVGHRSYSTKSCPSFDSVAWWYGG